jgi:hypothetical protein
LRSLGTQTKISTPVLKKEAADSKDFVTSGSVDTDALSAQVDIDLADSTNGVFTFTYDANRLTYQNVQFYADSSVVTPLYSVYREVKDGTGTITVAYAFSSVPEESTGKVLFRFEKAEDLPSAVEVFVKEEGNKVYDPAIAKSIELAAEDLETPDDSKPGNGDQEEPGDSSGSDGENGNDGSGSETPDDGHTPDSGNNAGSGNDENGTGNNGGSSNNNGSGSNGGSSSNNGTTTNVDSNGNKTVTKDPVKTGAQVAQDLWIYIAIAAAAVAAAVILVIIKRRKDKK